MTLDQIISRVLRTQNEQHTFCYCPNCNQELVGSGSFISDTQKGVTYKCQNCNCKSLWNFDHIAPLVVAYQKFESKMTRKTK